MLLKFAASLMSLFERYIPDDKDDNLYFGAEWRQVYVHTITRYDMITIVSDMYILACMPVINQQYENRWDE